MSTGVSIARKIILAIFRWLCIQQELHGGRFLFRVQLKLCECIVRRSFLRLRNFHCPLLLTPVWQMRAKIAVTNRENKVSAYPSTAYTQNGEHGKQPEQPLPQNGARKNRARSERERCKNDLSSTSRIESPE